MTEGRKAEGPAADTAEPAADFERLQQDWLRAVGVMAEQFARLSGAGAATGSAAGQARVAEAAAGQYGESLAMYERMVRAYAVWLEGGLGYLARVAEVNGSYASELYRRLGELSDGEPDERLRRELNDEARAYLRRLGDLSVQEARLLQQRLAELEAEFREPPAEGVKSDPRRLVRAKD